MLLGMYNCTYVKLLAKTLFTKSNLKYVTTLDNTLQLIANVHGNIVTYENSDWDVVPVRNMRVSRAHSAILPCAGALASRRDLRSARHRASMRHLPPPYLLLPRTQTSLSLFTSDVHNTSLYFNPTNSQISY